MHSIPASFANALILQADWEGGMANLALDLMDAGRAVSKVTLHAGDWIYKWKGVPTVDYDAPIEFFEDWLRNHIKQNGVDCIILYNHYRPYNCIGWSLAKEFGIECIVLELGLLRPDFCTIYSRRRNQFNYLARKWSRLTEEKHDLHAPEPPPQLSTMSTPCKITQFAFYYAFSRFMATFARQYRFYTDQRRLDFWHHLAAGLVSATRFLWRNGERRYNAVFPNEWSGKYYLAPLQIHCDSQVTQRSKFKSISDFIHLVANSFLKNAPEDTKLVFKVHPMNRGYRDYRKIIDSLNRQIGCNRIHYLDRIHLPTALDHARGCITINSSVGLSALIHQTPTITLGKAAYDHSGLTFQGQLDEFWAHHGKVSKKRVQNFIALLRLTSQAQGTLYQRLYACPGRCKIQWPQEFKTLFTKCQQGSHNTSPARHLDSLANSSIPVIKSSS